MRIERLILVGAGGHGKVVLDALAQEGGAEIGRIELADQQPTRHGAQLMGHVIQPIPVDDDLISACFHIAIGNCTVRARLHNSLCRRGAEPRTIVHPAAYVATAARVGAGSFLAARAVIAPGTTLGEGVIVNHGAVIDHDCCIGAFSHIAPGATLCGGVRIGAKVFIGAGVTILPGINVGDGAILAAGATIFRNVAAGETFIPNIVRKDGSSTQ